jgi:lysophospholipase-2
MCHGDCDQVVHFKYGEASYELLKGAGAQVEFQAYEFMGHEACPEELQSLRDFLQQCFAAAADGSSHTQ